MNKEELKQSLSMQEVIGRYGLYMNRTGFISCPFHKGDRTPSMKIYPKDYHCHACGANGDIFSFVMGMENCDFKTAFQSLGGTYEEKSDYQQKLFRYRLEKKKETQRIKDNNREKERLITIKEIEQQLLFKKMYLPMSDEWSEAVHRLEYLFYKLEVLTTEKR